MRALPDFSSAPAWADAAGNIWVTSEIIAEVGPGCIAESNAPWTPLDTAEGYVKRIGLNKLAEVIHERAHRHGHQNCTDIASSVIAALPELMGGEPRE